MSGSTAIFWPMIAQTALTFGIYALMSKRRFAAVRAGTAEARDYKIPSVEPQPSATAARNLMNQFELPMLFYVVSILFHVTAGASYLVVAVAWAFVASRFAHAYVHVTTNRLMLRRRLFLVGFFCTFLLWILFAAHIAIG